MKIKGKLIIPIIAIIIAMCTVGATPGFAGDTQPSTSVEDSYTYVKPTSTTAVPLEEQVGGYLSSAFGDQMQDIGESAKESGSLLNSSLETIRGFLYKILAFFENIGLVLGNGSLNLGGGLFG